MFQLSSDITIGQFRFSGVHSVQITRSMHSLSDRAVITLPSVARLIKKGKTEPFGIVTSTQFKNGDEVVIRLGYDGELRTEFKGFVAKCQNGTLAKIECEGASWLLKRNTVKEFCRTDKIKALLETAVSNLDNGRTIKVECEANFELKKFRGGSESGLNLINRIMAAADDNLTCYFKDASTLWCGLLHNLVETGELKPMGEAKYRNGWNVVEHGLMRRDELKPISFQYCSRLEDGNTVNSSGGADDNVRSKVLSQITSKSALKVLSDENAARQNYKGYEGKLLTFLQPYAVPGYIVTFEDGRHPDMKGSYVVESTDVTFGQSGARRHVELGIQKK